MTSDHSEHVLDNGLKVLLKEIHTAPLVSAWIWYRVGSRDESTGHTGLSHWCEHMLFKGTPRFPLEILDRAISRDGGVWNAFTFFDWTTFFETMPAGSIDLALQIESDRMVNCLFEEKEVAAERTVIVSEREGNQNEPLFLLGEAVQNAAFRIHPYHHEVIGDLPDILSMDREDLLRHYRSFYHPGNAVISVAGDFQTAQMLDRIRELYGFIPGGMAPERIIRPEPESLGEHRLVVEGPGETTYLDISYHAPAAGDPDFFPMSVLDSLLTGPSSLNMFGGGGTSNKTSHLYRNLVEKELAVAISGGLAATADPFLYSIMVTLPPGRDAQQVLPVVDDEIKLLQDKLVKPEEIQRATKQARAMFAYGSENITNQAFWLGHAEMFASYKWFLDYLIELSKVTPKDLQRVAQRYLRPQNRVVGTYLPKAGRTA